MLTIEQFNRDKKGFIKASEQNQEAGRLTYTWAGSDKIILDHTEVNPMFSGIGVGKDLVSAAVNFAREKHLKILPLCPFAKNVFQKNPEFMDVLF